MWGHISVLCKHNKYNGQSYYISKIVYLYNVQSLYTLYVYSNDIIIIQDQWTALHWATASGHTDCVSLLVASGASVDMKDYVS